MIDFDVKCLKNYPLKCNLSEVEKSQLVKSELYKGFLMFQFDGQNEYTIPTTHKFFRTPTYYLFDAKVEAGLGIKICKICRLALASDFGIASMTPLNYNVFFEIGLVEGFGKPVIYLVDKNYKKNGKSGVDTIPFDLSDQMVIEHSDKEELLSKLEKEIPVFIEKVQLSTIYENTFQIIHFYFTM